MATSANLGQEDEKIIMIVNPTAGTGKGEKMAEKVKSF